MSVTVRSLLFSLAAAGVLLATTGAYADSHTDGVIKHRKAIMRAVAGHMGAMAAIIKGQVPFKEDFKGHAHAMAELAKISGRVFPEGSDFGETGAKAEVWDKPDEFKMAIATFQKESGALAKVADGGDMKAIGAQFGKLGKSCKGCHEEFREKREKRQ